MNGCDQAVIDRQRDIRFGKTHLTGRTIVSGRSFSGSTLDGPAVCGSQCIDVLFECFVVASERVFPEHPVIGCLQQDVVGTGQFMFVSFCVLHTVKYEVRIQQVIRDLGRR